MSELSFRLEIFEGPLDLLLHLIAKHKLDINDIPIHRLLEQYLEYMDSFAELDMENAGEFLEMAARLIYIKTVSLLPVHEEADALKKELEGKLIEYSLCKTAAALLREKYLGSDLFVRLPMAIEIDNQYRQMHDPLLLLDYFKDIQSRLKDKEKIPVSAFSEIVTKKIVSVTSKIIFVLRKLYTLGKARFDQLFEGITDRSERVATFLAVLELTKSGRIVLSEDNREIHFNRNENLGSILMTEIKDEVYAD